MRVKFYINTGFAGCQHSYIEDFEDTPTEAELDSIVQEYIANEIEGGYKVLEGDDDDEE